MAKIIKEKKERMDNYQTNYDKLRKQFDKTFQHINDADNLNFHSMMYVLDNLTTDFMSDRVKYVVEAIDYVIDNYRKRNVKTDYYVDIDWSIDVVKWGDDINRKKIRSEAEFEADEKKMAIDIAPLIVDKTEEEIKKIKMDYIVKKVLTRIKNEEAEPVEIDPNTYVLTLRHHSTCADENKWIIFRNRVTDELHIRAYWDAKESDYTKKSRYTPHRPTLKWFKDRKWQTKFCEEFKSSALYGFFGDARDHGYTGSIKNRFSYMEKMEKKYEIERIPAGRLYVVGYVFGLIIDSKLCLIQDEKEEAKKVDKEQN